MAGFNYTRLQRTALKLLTRFGPVAGATYSRVTQTHTLATASATESTTSYSIKAVELDASQAAQRYRGADGGSLISVGDRLVYATGSDLTIEPQAGDTITINGLTLRVIALVEKIAPAGTAVLYVILCRV